MAIIKVTNSKASIGKVINYVTKEEKTEDKLVSGINCTPETVLDEMKVTKEQFRKTDGRQYAHYIHSFKPGEQITHEKAHKLALELSEKQFKGYEVLVATHKDKDHIHSHIIVNSVSYEYGRKLHSSKKDLAEVKELSNKICEREG
ncbi:relaxase/mobilization nuclease domain-containing protein, partial [Clostridium cagae]|uniref:relaxase/mobilization nuclease domain-containing protein n=1 Tax=Clostridium cagae TaxID=2080751 RepID=UPI003F7614CC